MHFSKRTYCFFNRLVKSHTSGDSGTTLEIQTFHSDSFLLKYSDCSLIQFDEDQWFFYTSHLLTKTRRQEPHLKDDCPDRRTDQLGYHGCWLTRSLAARLLLIRGSERSPLRGFDVILEVSWDTQHGADLRIPDGLARANTCTCTVCLERQSFHHRSKTIMLCVECQLELYGWMKDNGWTV